MNNSNKIDSHAKNHVLIYVEHFRVQMILNPGMFDIEDDKVPKRTTPINIYFLF